MSTRPRLSPGSDGAHPRRLLIIGGGADRSCGTGVLERFAGLCGGAQVWILALVGSRANEVLREQLGHGLAVAGTSAGATALATSPDGTLRAALDLATPANPRIAHLREARPGPGAAGGPGSHAFRAGGPGAASP